MSEVWTIGKILKWTEEYFQKAQLDSPRLDAEVLLAHVLNRPERIYLYVHFDQPLEQSELAKATIKEHRVLDMVEIKSAVPHDGYITFTTSLNIPEDIQRDVLDMILRRGLVD